MEEKLEKYFKLTGEALEKASKSKEALTLDRMKNARDDFLDMAKRYFKDAKHFDDKDDKLNALIAVCYAHAFLDAGARLGLFDVKDNELFMVD